jgi:CubicO group peptidase (beta-lactamase class C family)
MFRTLRRFAICFLWVPLVVSAPRIDSAAQDKADERGKKVDELFARWDKSDSPGCAVAVVQDGKVVYEKGYGMANLEHGARITPATVFLIASVSKQFTAFLIFLLAGAGQLSLDDDVRKHVPEVPDFGKKITVRHLVHHTSGLREELSLFSLAGWRSSDVIMRRDFLELVGRQRELNFEPGREYLYCNTGYTLMGLIVERVSKKSLNAYAQEKIFEPLGMKSTQFRQDYRLIAARLATSYGPRTGGGFELVPLAYGQAGASSVLTTVQDLARWDQNFYDPKVGGKEATALMLQRGKLNSGTEIAYAGGLFHGTYRSLPTVQHTGSHGGYRTILMRFPEQRFSVIVLANVASFKSVDMARKVADIYLEGTLKPEARKPMGVPVDTQILDSYRGEYLMDSGFSLKVSREDAMLVVEAPYGKRRLTPSSATEFIDPASDDVYTFVPAAKGDAMALRTKVSGFEQTGQKLTRIELTREELAKFAGSFHSEELDVFYTTVLRDGQLVLRHRKGEIPLRPAAGDRFTPESGGAMFQTLHFTRNADKEIDGFRVTTGRVRNLRFANAQIKTL